MRTPCALLVYLAVLLAPSSAFPQTDKSEAKAPPAGWKEHTSKDKSLTIWVPAKGNRQSERDRTSTIKGKQFKIHIFMVQSSGVTYQVEELTLPPGIFENLKPEDLMESLRDSLASESRGKVTKDSDIKVPGSSKGKEYVIQAGASNTRARMFMNDNHFYLITIAGSKKQVEAEAADTFLDSARIGEASADTTPAPKEAVPKKDRATKGKNAPDGDGPTRILGGVADPQFGEVAPNAGFLVGFEVGTAKFGRNDVVKSIRPLFRSGETDTPGTLHGTDVSQVVKVVAKPQYAVGAITVKSGLGVDGFSATFMKIKGTKLDPADSYESEWIGGEGSGGKTKLGGDGTAVVGLIGKSNARDLSGIGLLLGIPGKVRDVWSIGGEPTAIQGGAFDPEFREPGPENAMLAGIEVGLGKFVGNDVIKGVRPIYRVDGKDVSGDMYGANYGKTVKAVAKPGYAVGAINTKAGLGVDGFSITFMKVDGGKLDKSDSYESEWIGGMGGGGKTLLGGDGTPVTGLIGKQNKDSKEMTGLGLLLGFTRKTQAK